MWVILSSARCFKVSQETLWLLRLLLLVVGVGGSQFHQHFTSSFFTQKCLAKLYFLTVWFCWFFCRKRSSAKADCKMFVKLTSVVNFIDISLTAFYEREKRSFYTHTVWICNFLSIENSLLQRLLIKFGEIDHRKLKSFVKFSCWRISPD